MPMVTQPHAYLHIESGQATAMDAEEGALQLHDVLRRSDDGICSWHSARQFGKSRPLVKKVTCALLSLAVAGSVALAAGAGWRNASHPGNPSQGLQMAYQAAGGKQLSAVAAPEQAAGGQQVSAVAAPEQAGASAVAAPEQAGASAVAAPEQAGASAVAAPEQAGASAVAASEQAVATQVQEQAVTPQVPGGPLVVPDDCAGMGCDWIAKSPNTCVEKKDTQVYRCCCGAGMVSYNTGLVSLQSDPTKCLNIKVRGWEDDLLNSPTVQDHFDDVLEGPCQYGNRNMEFDVPQYGPGVVRLANDARKCLGVASPYTVGSAIQLSFCGKGRWLGQNRNGQQWEVSAMTAGQMKLASDTTKCMDLQPTGLVLSECDNSSGTQIFQVAPQTAPGADASPSIFCTALMMPFGYEVGLIQAQATAGVGIFGGCDEYAVFTNMTIDLGNGASTTLMEGSLDAPRGGKFKTALNTGVFVRFWAAVVDDPRSSQHDWIVKADPDCVFFAPRLKELLRLSFQPDGVAGKAAYINNCYLGLHGPIEVMSKEALAVYKGSAAECDADAQEHGQEDVWLRHCLDRLEIEKVDAYNILWEADWACNERDFTRDERPPCFGHQVSFHPFKSEDAYFQCYNQAASREWILPMYPTKEEPASYNFHHA